MNKDDIKNYFDLYVLNYQPYKNIPEYQAIIKTLIDFYFDHAYNHLNLPFKKAFEQQHIPTEFYEKLLLSIGFPEKILNLLTLKDKKILLHSFMDYNRYKGTIEQFKLVGEKFGESVGIYELYIDLKDITIPFYKLYVIHGQSYFNLENVNLYNKLEVNDIIFINQISYAIIRKSIEPDGSYRVYIDREYPGSSLIIEDFNVKRWVFVPHSLYVSPNVTQVTDYFDYEKIYQETKQYFVSSEFLTAKYNNNEIVLPIKSNLLFLDYKKYTEINTFYNLLAAIFVKEYYNNKFIINFKEEKQYLISLGRFIKLWYYILFKFYNYNIINTVNLDIVSIDITSINFDYNVNDISNLVLEYNNLKDLDEYSQFYANKISNKFLNKSSLSNISLEEYELILENEVGLDLIDYVKNRIQTSTSSIKEYEYNFILNELYNSLITWVFFEKESPNGDIRVSNNIEYLIKNLNFISYPISMSPTYNLLMFLKPYHVEIIKELSQGIYIKDIGNSAILNDEKLNKLYLLFLRASSLNLSENILQTITYNNLSEGPITNGFSSESLTISHGRIYSLEQLILDFNDINTDLFKFVLFYEREIINQPHSVFNILKIYPIFKNIVEVVTNNELIVTQLINLNLTPNVLNNQHFLKLLKINNYELVNNINKYLTGLDNDSSSFVNSDVDLKVSIAQNINNVDILSSPLKTNILILHNYNLI